MYPIKIFITKAERRKLKNTTNGFACC